MSHSMYYITRHDNLITGGNDASFFCCFGFSCGQYSYFFHHVAKSARERGEADALKSRLAEAEAVKTEAESCRVAAAKALATLESLEKQTQHERELVSGAHERELQNLREAHAKETGALLRTVPE